MIELKKFLKVVNGNDFVQGHEVLEDKWREWKNLPEKREESFILKGLINGSTALALKVLKRNEPSLRVWNTYLKYIRLIDEVDSPYTKTYNEAKSLLEEKSEEFRLFS